MLIKSARLEGVPIFRVTLVNRLRLPITAQNITFGLALCIFGLLLISITFIEPFVGIPTHLLYTFATGCQVSECFYLHHHRHNRIFVVQDSNA